MSLAHTPTAELVQRRSLAEDVSLAIIGSALMALCAHVSLPLVISPVPITLQTFGLLFIAFTMGPQRAFAAMTLYLAEGAAGLPVFSPTGPGGIAQLLGPTGGYLMAYPFAAFVAGAIFTRRQQIGMAYVAAVAGEAVLFASGLVWFKFVMNVSFAQAFAAAVAPFVAGEVIKVIAAAAAGAGARRWLTRFR